jgi:signal transduction histidine kinase
VTQPSEINTERTAGSTAGSAAARPLGLLLAAAFTVLLVLAGVNPWWMIALAAVAAPLGLTDDGARRGVVAMAVATGAGAIAVVAGWADPREALVTAARDVVTGVLPWSVAIAWRARRSAESDAAIALLREQDAQRMRAETDLARQRLHLAEGLHDDLGHALSLVALNLGRLELELEHGLASGPEKEHAPANGHRPDVAASARECVGLARRQVSDAVARLGASVQTLRTGLAVDPPATTAEADLDTLVRDARRAGADVELRSSPGPDRLAAFGPIVVRVVQEGLTNALKHAPGQPVRVALDADGERLLVTVRNPLPGLAGEPVPGVGGTGVRSLTEHVHAAGGSVEAGPGDGGYTLRAVLRPTLEDPASAPAPPAGQGAADSPAPGGRPPQAARAVTNRLARARRRGGALLLVAVLVPAVALVLVAAAIQLADHLDARRARLDPEAFARIAVGDARSDVEPVLPGATLEPPSGADPACDYYAVTADPLADASGDAYRICWADDRVASTDLVVGGAR